MPATMSACTACETPTDRLDLFPGDLCLSCYAATEPPMPTADELTRMWGGRA
jgi:hypothetical protein